MDETGGKSVVTGSYTERPSKRKEERTEFTKCRDPFDVITRESVNADASR